MLPARRPSSLGLLRLCRTRQLAGFCAPEAWARSRYFRDLDSSSADLERIMSNAYVPANVNSGRSVRRRCERVVRAGFLATVTAAQLVLCVAHAAAQADTAKPPVNEVLQQQMQNAQQVRDRIRQSGLTPEQIRSQLQAKGMSASLLDPYLPGAAAGEPGIGEVIPGRDVLAAVAVLSTVDQNALDAATARTRGGGSNARGPTTEDGLPVFGMDIFRNGSNQFEPNVAGPVDASYRLGPLDVVAVILTGQVEFSHTLEVTRDGFIVIPQVGQVFVANMALEEARSVIVQRLRTAYSGAGTSPTSPTRVYVTVAHLRSNQIFVIGDVSAPGSYQVSAAGTALTAIYAAGGPTISGSMRSIEIRRAGRVVATLDLYDYLLRGDASKDVRLEHSDIVFVPPVKRRVGITGEVVRPGAYELKPNETLADLVATVGGLKPTASRQRINISRILPPQERGADGRDRVLLDIHSDSFARGEIPATRLEAGDRITVFPVSGSFRGRVTVSGNVWIPGEVGFKPGITLSELFRAAGGVRPDTYSEVQVLRLLPDQSRTILTVRLDSLSRPAPEFVLMDQDEVRVFSTSQFRSERWIRVEGDVKKGGEIPYADGMTLRQAIALSGGLQESALLNEVEISRVAADRTKGQIATVFRAPIDSSYLFERSAGGRYLGPPGLPSRASGAPDVLLQPYDQVNVLRQPDWEIAGTVTIGGQVKFPGAYSIAKRGERLSDLIKRAGGLTDRAYVDGVVFKRPVDPSDVGERKRLLDRVTRDREYALAVERMQAGAVQTAQAGSTVTQAAQETQAALAAALGAQEDSQERIAIDLRHALRDPGFRDNLILMPGDAVEIPEYSATVTVRGFVSAPVSVPYKPGESLKYYVNAAGGATRNADLYRSFVQEPNGAVESYQHHRLAADNVPTPKAGAVIIVPPREARVDRGAGNSNWIVAFSALASIATAAAALISITR